MRLKLDENLGRRGLDILRQAGHDVTTVAEEGLSTAADPMVLGACQSEGRCLVTLDVGFGNPLVYRPGTTAGIAVLRLPRAPVPNDLLDAVRTLVGALAKSTITGKLWIVQRGRVREYQPPDGDDD